MSPLSLINWMAPGFVIAGLLCIIYASMYHLWSGRSARDLVVYIVAACVGFFIGQLIGLVTQISLLEIGQLRVIEGTIGSWLVLIGTQTFIRGSE